MYYDGKGYGGAEVHLGLLLKYLDRSRYEPVVVVPGRLWSGFSSELGDTLSVHGIPAHVTPELDGSGGAVRQMLRIVRMLRALRCDLAYVGTSTAIGLRKDLLALRLAGMRVVRLLHMPASSMVAFQSRPWSPWSVRELDKLVALNLCVSGTDREELIRLFGLPERKIEVCYHGLELDRLVPRRAPSVARQTLGLDPGIPAVGLIGRFSAEKGHRFLVAAAPAILEQMGLVQFVLAGSGPLQPEIEALVAERGLESRFVFAGFQRDVKPWIEALDVAVVPSQFESAGLVLLECLALERPVVASDLPAFREHIGADACRLIPIGDTEALSRAVVEVLRDPDGSTQIARRGRQIVQERFDIRRHVGQIMDTLDRVPGNR